MGREKDVQKQMEESKIREAKYNKKYKNIEVDGRRPKYLEKYYSGKGEFGMGVRALISLRCGNMEHGNKYWLKEENTRCVQCEKGWDNLEHFVKECEITKEWFKEIGENEEERMKRIWNDDLDGKKIYVLKKIWFKKGEEKRKKKDMKEVENEEKEQGNRRLSNL